MWARKGSSAQSYLPDNTRPWMFAYGLDSRYRMSAVLQVYWGIMSYINQGERGYDSAPPPTQPTRPEGRRRARPRLRWVQCSPPPGVNTSSSLRSVSSIEMHPAIAVSNPAQAWPSCPEEGSECAITSDVPLGTLWYHIWYHNFCLWSHNCDITMWCDIWYHMWYYSDKALYHWIYKTISHMISNEIS